MSEKPGEEDKPKTKTRKFEDLSQADQNQAIVTSTSSSKRYKIALTDLPTFIIVIIGGFASSAKEVFTLLQTTKNIPLAKALKDNDVWFPLYLRKYGLWDLHRFSKDDGSRDPDAERFFKEQAERVLFRTILPDVVDRPRVEDEAKRKLWYWAYQRRKKVARVVSGKWGPQNLRIAVATTAWIVTRDERFTRGLFVPGIESPFVRSSAGNAWTRIITLVEAPFSAEMTLLTLSKPWEDPLWTRSAEVSIPDFANVMLAGVPMRNNRLFLWTVHDLDPYGVGKGSSGVFRIVSWSPDGKEVSHAEFWLSPKDVFTPGIKSRLDAQDLHGRTHVLYDAERDVLAFVSLFRFFAARFEARWLVTEVSLSQRKVLQSRRVDYSVPSLAISGSSGFFYARGSLWNVSHKHVLSTPGGEGERRFVRKTSLLLSRNLGDPVTIHDLGGKVSYELIRASGNIVLIGTRESILIVSLGEIGRVPRVDSIPREEYEGWNILGQRLHYHKRNLGLRVSTSFRDLSNRMKSSNWKTSEVTINFEDRPVSELPSDHVIWADTQASRLTRWLGLEPRGPIGDLYRVGKVQFAYLGGDPESSLVFRVDFIHPTTRHPLPVFAYLAMGLRAVDVTEEKKVPTRRILLGSETIAQRTFHVRAVAKTEKHPFHGRGCPMGYAVDGIEGKELVLRSGRTYAFAMDREEHDRFPIYLGTSESGGFGRPGNAVPGTVSRRETVPREVTTTFEVPSCEGGGGGRIRLYYQCAIEKCMGGEITLE